MEHKAIVRPQCMSVAEKSHRVEKKRPPKIRIVHIIAPEVIKTDAKNFRELVQSLTGKPVEKNSDASRRIGKKKKNNKRTTTSSSSIDNKKDLRGIMCVADSEMNRFDGLGCEVWGGEFGDLEKVVHGVVNTPRLVPLNCSSTCGCEVDLCK